MQPKTPGSPRAQRSMSTNVLLAVSGVALAFFLLHCGRLPPSAQDAVFIFYQPLALLVAMAWLWSFVIDFFEKHSIRYEACFLPEHHDMLLPAKAIQHLAAFFTCLVTTSLALFTYFAANGFYDHAGVQPVLLYSIVVLTLANPADCFWRGLYGSQRWFLLDTLRRVALPMQVTAVDLQAVLFTDFLLADILTSLAKPLSDVGLAVCYFVARPPLGVLLRDQSLKPGVCTSHSWQIPVVLALPYVWRLVQCLIIVSATGDMNQVWNAVKYSTALPVVFLSFIKYSVPLSAWRSFWKPLWVLSAMINSSYAFFWDVEKDWDIKLFTAGPGQPAFKSEVRLTQDETPYYALIGVNLVLRVAWSYKLSAHLRHLRLFVSTMALLEEIRRFLWAFVRLEHELRKIESKGTALSPLIPYSPHRKDTAQAQELWLLSPSSASVQPSLTKPSVIHSSR